MKNFISFSVFLSLAISSFSVFASTTDSYSFSLGNLEVNEAFSLNTTQTKTNYRYESRAQTCYRSELYRYRSSCDYSSRPYCYETRDSARICNYRQVPNCIQIPEYREIPYTCYQTETIPYEVDDHDVFSSFKIKVTSRPKEPTNPTNCSVEVKAEGDELRYLADCEQQLIFANELKSSKIDRYGAIYNEYTIGLKILDAETILAPVSSGIDNMRMEGHQLTFKSGDLTKNPSFNLKLYVEKKHFFKKDEVLISRNLTPSEYTFEKISDAEGIVKVNFDKLLGGFEDSKKHQIKASLTVILESGKLINVQTPSLEASESIKVDK